MNCYGHTSSATDWWSCCDFVLTFFWIIYLFWFVFHTQPLIYLFREYLRSLWNTYLFISRIISSVSLVCLFPLSSLLNFILPQSRILSVACLISLFAIPIIYALKLVVFRFLICLLFIPPTKGNFLLYCGPVMEFFLATVSTLLAVSCKIFF